MWTKERILGDLSELNITPGDAVLVHASMRAVGPVEGGADTVVEALLEAVSPEGTVVAPVFHSANRLTATEHESDLLSSDGESFQPDAVSVEEVGILAQRIALHPDARRSSHPAHSFAAIGSNADFLTANVPFNYPLGTNGTLAKLHQLNGKILLLGVGHAANCSIHLAELWADAPYARRKARVRTGEESWQEMEGSPECSGGFARIESILRQARIIKTGYVGNAPSQAMRVQFVVSMAREMLIAQPDCLLCDDPGCEPCALARKLTRAQDAPGTIDR
jgi:aminoglycoside 3-N-acetyltransferase